MVVVERSGNADDDGIHLRDFRVVGSGVEADFLRLLDGLGQNPDDVRATAVERGNLGLLNVKTGDTEAFLAEK